MGKTPLTEPEMYALLAKNLSYLRKSQGGLSKKTVARILHLPPKTIMNYENCRATPLAYAVLKLAEPRSEKKMGENVFQGQRPFQYTVCIHLT